MYNEEVQSECLEVMKKHGFPMGRMLERSSTDEVTFNAVIGTTEDGPFWYGDIAKSDYPRLFAVTAELNKELVLE